MWHHNNMMHRHVYHFLIEVNFCTKKFLKYFAAFGFEEDIYVPSGWKHYARDRKTLRGTFVSPGITFFSLKDTFSWGFILWPSIHLYILMGSVSYCPYRFCIISWTIGCPPRGVGEYVGVGKCVCHCRRAMFRVLGMYNFGYSMKQNPLKCKGLWKVRGWNPKKIYPLGWKTLYLGKQKFASEFFCPWHRVSTQKEHIISSAL